jgi:hypothetical protein
MPTQCCKDTWEKIPDDEPVFILRGKDLLATDVVREWIVAARRNDVNPDKIARAKEHLNAIDQFQGAHPERCKIPD